MILNIFFHTILVMKILKACLIYLTLTCSCWALPITKSITSNNYKEANSNSEYLKFKGSSTKFGFVTTSFDGYAIVSRKALADGSVEINTTHNGHDGNDNKKAIIRKTYTIGKNTFTNRKEVQFEGTTAWIMRTEYSYSK